MRPDKAWEASIDPGRPLESYGDIRKSLKRSAAPQMPPAGREFRGEVELLVKTSRDAPSVRLHGGKII